ncbi:MAG: amidohydrolase [Gemmatimonadetes bacterium]|nr:amidohydrolase [Gemmatimonadota bacterium]
MTSTRTFLLALSLLLPAPVLAQTSRSATLLEPDAKRLSALTAEVDAGVQRRAKLVQVMVDKLFSFSELGFQELETSRYITGVLRENGFHIRAGVSGIPTAWVATWGSGEPVIAFGSDIDGIPKASQKPGVAYHDPLVEGAPGHGEGHNSGQVVNIAAALALKEVMERERIPGTIVLWPGVAEELLGAKAWFVRDGLFRDVDAVLFTHVGDNLGASWGAASGTGLVSAEFAFAGEAAHAAGSPWRGKSALDAVELMNVAWNYRREHMRPTQRSHYVIPDGGDQPNVVPSAATVWYFVRETEQPEIKANFDALVRIAGAAAVMTETEMSYRVVGTAYPRHFNRPIAEAMDAHVREVGLPTWTAADQTLARAIQQEVGSKPRGLADTLGRLGPPPTERESGGSDDIGDVSWTLPTITLRYPSNIPGLPGHHWANAVSMATPIAHKGVVAGARVMARSALEMYLRPRLVQDAWTYFRDVQNKDEHYIPFLEAGVAPPIEKNRATMERFRPLLEPFYYDETSYDSYLEQLGIEYPTVRKQTAPAPAADGR